MSERSSGRGAAASREGNDDRALDRPPLVLCPHCGMTVPEGDFCGHCGAHLTTASTTRRHAFAAVPSESVAHLSIVTTLFPHLAHRRGGAFRWALLGGGAAVVLLAVLQLFAPATAVATFLLPGLYLLYLYEVEVYESEPWLVIGVTMVAGAVFGYVFTAYSGDALAQLNLTGDSSSAYLLAGVAIPIVAQALMLAGPLFLYSFRGRFREPLDGLTFGAASALGFTLASSLATFWPLISGPLVGSGPALDWALRLLQAGILIALINASTTGLITAAIWLHRYDLRRSRGTWYASILATLMVALGAQILIAMLSFVIPDLITQVVIRSLATIGLLLCLRLVLHRALLAEGAVHEIGRDAPCPECHRVVPTMLFCPACGVNRSASSKHSRPVGRSA
ncbi:MAG: PrsW family intramembrane metalloprotease [Candidatus Dormibacteraeota bacterium]|nr:PrsW family intramembrane metalloprotease [Candidatus Dormibacteraeota bacterium]